MTEKRATRVCVRHARLWNGTNLVRVSKADGVVSHYVSDGYAAVVRFKGFRGQYVIPVTRLLRLS